MKQLLLAATLALSLAAPASAAVQTADRIVAVINNGVITLSELQQREAEITASLKRQNVALPPASVLSRQVLDLMVNEQLQLQYAASNGLRVSESEIDQTLQLVEDNEYGWCESCGVEIGIRRLEARPTADLCVDCKTLAEIKEKQVGK